MSTENEVVEIVAEEEEEDEEGEEIEEEEEEYENAKPEDPDEKRVGCAHYKRRAKFVTPCCNKMYMCRYCHDENEQHYFNRKTVTELICTECDTRQKVQAECIKCGVRFGKIFPLLEDHPAVPSPSCSSVVGSLEPLATTSAPATQDNYEVEEAVTTPVHTNKEAVQDPHHPTEDVQRPDERESRANRTPRPSVGRGWLGGTLTARLVDVEERRLLQTDRRIDVEERRLAVETQRLAVETQRLAVEERRLAVEEQRLALEQERQLAP